MSRRGDGRPETMVTNVSTATAFTLCRKRALYAHVPTAQMAKSITIWN